MTLNAEETEMWRERVNELGIAQVLYELHEQGYPDHVLVTFCEAISMRPSDIMEAGDWPKGRKKRRKPYKGTQFEED